MAYKVKSRTIGEANMPWKAIEYPAIASIKYDGRNTIVHKKGNKITYETSGGKEFLLVNNEPFDQLPDGHFFTEMMGSNAQGFLGERTQSGIQTSCVSNTSKGLPNHHIPNWKIFSYLNDEDYTKGKSSDRYHTILSRINQWDNIIGADFCPRFMRVENEYQLKLYYSQVIAEGWEGLMVSSADQRWDNSTSRLKTLCKLKGRYTMKGTCIGFEAGTGKHINKIGSLVLKLENGKTVPVGSGGGDDNWRLLDESSYLNKVIEFNYEQISKYGIPQQPTLPKYFIREAL